jgi:hypothetical protein
MQGCLFFPTLLAMMLSGVLFFGVSNSVSTTGVSTVMPESEEGIAIASPDQLGIEQDGVMVNYQLTPHGAFDAVESIAEGTVSLSIPIAAETPVQATARTEDGAWVLFGYYDFVSSQWKLAWGSTENFAIDTETLMALQVVDPNSEIFPGPIPIE